MCYLNGTSVKSIIQFIPQGGACFVLFGLDTDFGVGRNNSNFCFGLENVDMSVVAIRDIND